MGLIKPTHSLIFAIKNKNGNLRLVQDFKALNSHINSMKDVSE